jgi:hypothetical protein
VSDASVHVALRSDNKVVLIDAPAGCGKTHQGAELARDLAQGTSSRVLILTHTHAACSVFAERTIEVRSRVTIRTIDSLVAEIAGIYHAALGLPADIPAWVRQQGQDGHADLCEKVSALLAKRPMIARAVAARHGVIVCDEHQDSSATQHSVIMALNAAGAALRVFADPMQRIFKQTSAQATPASSWETWKAKVPNEQLDYPHRWKSQSLELGEWTLRARETLRTGGRIDLRGKLPAGLHVVFAKNQAQGHADYRLTGQDRKRLDAFVRKHDSLLVLTRYNERAARLRAFWQRSIPLWEGHTRAALDVLGDALGASQGEARKVAQATTDFVEQLSVGLSASAFGDRFRQEVETGCAKQAKGKPAIIQRLARHIVEHPNHQGVARVLREIWALRKSDEAFSAVEIDGVREYWDAIRLGDYETVDAGMLDMASRRNYLRPKPPSRAISTIHKAKGLECGAALVLPCDAKTFADNDDARCVLYVAISRACGELMIVLPREMPSPLLQV